MTAVSQPPFRRSVPCRSLEETEGGQSAVSEPREPVPRSGRETRCDSLPIPTRCTLHGFADEVTGIEGVELEELDPFTQIVVHTSNSSYLLVVIDPWTSRIVIRGGHFFPEPSEVVLCGSSFGGSFLKTRWIGCGMRMEVWDGQQRIVTSRIRRVDTQPPEPLPGPF